MADQKNKRVKNFLFIVVLFVGMIPSIAQISESEKDNEGPVEGGVERKFQKKKKEREKPPITEYKIISYTRDTTHVDTTLSMKKEYKFNYLRRDNFELHQFSNTGQTYNSLAKVEDPFRLMPRFGARARHFNFMEVEDISYYHVPTPLTEAYFKTTMEQGQQLDTFFTININPQLNFSFAYKGMRSLGKYKHLLTSTGNFRTTVSYNTRNNRYQNRMHFVSQDLLNEENGGLRADALGLYQLAQAEGDLASDDREQLDVNYEDAQSLLKGKRFYLDHQYNIKRKDSTSSSAFYVQHQMDMTDKSYLFQQTNSSLFFGDALVASSLRDDVALEDFTNELSLHFEHKYLGNFTASGSHTNFNYGYKSVYNFENGDQITNRLKGETTAVGGAYENNYKGFDVYVKAKAIISGDFTSQNLQAGLGYVLDADNRIKLQATISSKPANYNFLLHQSVYKEYNWQREYSQDDLSSANGQNTTRAQFKNIEQQDVRLVLNSKKLLDVSAQLTNITNFTYFGSERIEVENPEVEQILDEAGNSIDTDQYRDIVSPQQASDEINLLKVTAHREFKFWKLGLDNTFMYQQVKHGDLIKNGDVPYNVYNVPRIVTRNALYFNDHLFKKALFLQTGVMVKYFSEYTADGYDPLLAEFYTQNEDMIGGFPVVDIFINAKVRQTRIFFKLENFNELFQQNIQLAAPLHPTRDFIIRFGLVWNFFM